VLPTQRRQVLQQGGIGVIATTAGERACGAVEVDASSYVANHIALSLFERTYTLDKTTQSRIRSVST
jgi:hypothetical protein